MATQNKRKFLIVKDGYDLEDGGLVEATNSQEALITFQSSEDGIPPLRLNGSRLYPGEGKFLIIELAGLSFNLERPKELKLTEGKREVY